MKPYCSAPGLLLLSAFLVVSCSAKTPPDVPQEKLQSFPIARAHERILKKPFGIYVSPDHSPVSPERFLGYHTGVDFEAFAGEEQSDIPISAICSGDVVLKRWINGYGGVVVQQCDLPEIGIVTALYGHLDIDSVHADRGNRLSVGDRIGILGAGYSKQTDGERKHLHLAIHKGMEAELRGYVHNQEELSEWVDPLPFLHN